MSREVQRIGDILGELERTRQAAPSEVSVAADGSQAVISWQGTPVTELWLSGYVDRLIAARLVEPWASAADTDEMREQSRVKNTDRLGAWHRALGGLPKEGLESARVHFERHGTGNRWFLRPADVSQWVRARAVRCIPDGQECEAHPGRWADTCSDCAADRRKSMSPDAIRRIREQMEQEAGR